MNFTNNQMFALNVYLQEIIHDNQYRTELINMLSANLNNQHHTRKLYVLQGTGNNGKSTFIDLVQRVMGSLCQRVDDEVIYHPSNSLVLLSNMILNKKLIIVETNHNYLSEAMRELLTGNEIQLGQKYQSLNSINLTFDIIICTNQQFKPDPLAIIIPFEHIFIDHPDSNDPKTIKRYDVRTHFDEWVPILKSMLTMIQPLNH